MCGLYVLSRARCVHVKLLNDAFVNMCFGRTTNATYATYSVSMSIDTFTMSYVLATAIQHESKCSNDVVIGSPIVEF